MEKQPTINIAEFIFNSVRVTKFMKIFAKYENTVKITSVDSIPFIKISSRNDNIFSKILSHSNRQDNHFKTQTSNLNTRNLQCYT